MKWDNQILIYEMCAVEEALQMNKIIFDIDNIPMLKIHMYLNIC